MKKLFRIIKFFFIYRKNIHKNKAYLLTKYGLNIDRLDRLWTVLTLVDVPEQIRETQGIGLYSSEIKKYTKNFNADLPKIDLFELVKPYELKKIDNDNYGITFGYSLCFNETFYAIAAIIAILLLSGLGLGIYFIL